MPNEIQIQPKQTQSKITINCDDENLGEFLAGLLGKPQSITRIMHEEFCIDSDKIINIHHLVSQRVHDQHRANLVDFTAAIRFNNGLSVEYKDINDLISHRELTPVISIGVSLTWIFLIQFHGRETPEKQQIDVDIQTNNSIIIGAGTLFEIISQKPFTIIKNIINPLHVHFPGYIGLRVQHTSRTWGADIENMLSNHLKGIFEKENTLNAIAKKISPQISIFMYVLLVSALWQVMRRGGDILFNSANVEFMKKMKDSTNPHQIEYYMQLLADFLLFDVFRYNFSTVSIFFITSFITIPLFINLIMQGVFRDRKSFILLTDKARSKFESHKRRSKRKWYLTCGFIIMNITLGVAGNIVYAFLDKL